MVNGRTLHLKINLFDKLFSSLPHWSSVFCFFMLFVLYDQQIQNPNLGIRNKTSHLFVWLIFRESNLFSTMNVFYDYLYNDF
jgi:hypothetical protein